MYCSSLAALVKPRKNLLRLLLFFELFYATRSIFSYHRSLHFTFLTLIWVNTHTHLFCYCYCLYQKKNTNPFSQHELLREDDTLPLNTTDTAVSSVSAASTGTVKSDDAGVNEMVTITAVQPAQPVESTIAAATDKEILVVPAVNTANGNVIINMGDLERSNEEQRQQRNNQNV